MSSTALVCIPRTKPLPEPVDPHLLRLRQTVLDSVVSEHSKRNYAKALDHLFEFLGGRPIDRAALLEWRATMEKLAPSTVNVRLSAMRKLALMICAAPARNFAEKRGRSRADQVPSRPFIDPDYGALSWVKAGVGGCCE